MVVPLTCEQQNQQCPFYSNRDKDSTLEVFTLIYPLLHCFGVKVFLQSLSCYDTVKSFNLIQDANKH